MIDARRLLIFGEVARTGSMAAAARALGWTQPAVSQHVRRLERDLGTPLIVRGGRGVVLTAAGRTLVGHAERVAEQISRAEQEIAALVRLRTGRLRLAAFPSACATIVPRAMRRLARRAPGMDIELTQTGPGRARALVLAGECDIAVVFGYADTDEPGLSYVPLFEDEMFAVLPEAHPAAGRAGLGLAQLAGERWITGCPDCRGHLLACTAHAGFTPDVRPGSSDYLVGQELVAAGLGVAVLPALALEAAGHPQRAVAATRITDMGTFKVGLVHRHGGAAVPAVSAGLAEFVRVAAARP